MKRYYQLLVILALGLSIFLVLLFRNNWKFSHLFGGELSGGVIRFSYSTNSSWGFGEKYEVYLEDGTPYLKISINDFSFRAPEFSGMDKIEDLSYLETFELDPSILGKMQNLANKHKIWQREGSYDNTMVLDGDSWSFYMEFGDEELVTARGYMASPKGFYEGMGEFLELFEKEYTQTREKADALLESLQNF